MSKRIVVVVKAVNFDSGLLGFYPDPDFTEVSSSSNHPNGGDLIKSHKLLIGWLLSTIFA
ncbi:MAG: hypothetical protein ING69_02615 [Rhodocyclaceae bacterium]|nr:hypothetical protein [Rhodocyclaceae bacterium]